MGMPPRHRHANANMANRPIEKDMRTPAIPANQSRFSRFRDPIRPDATQWQEWQIVQPWLNLRDFLP